MALIAKELEYQAAMEDSVWLIDSCWVLSRAQASQE